MIESRLKYLFETSLHYKRHRICQERENYNKFIELQKANNRRYSLIYNGFALYFDDLKELKGKSEKDFPDLKGLLNSDNKEKKKN